MTRIVIDIPDDNYKRIRELAEVNGLSNNLMGYSLLAIAHGTVLPKGHGDLIDANELINDIVEYSTNLGGVMAVKTECIKVLFEIATIVIEADKENRND